MKTKYSIAFVLIIVFSSLVYAASSEGQISFDNQGGKIVVSAGSCEEDWSGSTWSQCTNNQQTFICFDRNYCGTTNLKPANCDTTRSCGSISSGSSGGGSGGGGSSGSSGGNSVTYLSTGNENQTQNATCIEKWECDAWSNEGNACGTRTCTDLNSCNTTDLKPFVNQKCEVGFIETLLSFMTGGVIFGGTVSDSKVSGDVLRVILIAMVIAIIGTAGAYYWRKNNDKEIKKKVKEMLKKKK